MIRKIFLSLIILVLTVDFCNSQAFIRTSDLFKRPESPGKLNIYQNQAIDTLLSRYILSNNKPELKTADGKQGMTGVRIQIYYNSVRNAHEEANKVMLQFLNKFGDIKANVEYTYPGWYMVRVGNYRTKIEAYKDLMMIRRDFPDAYSVIATINFPDLTKK